MILWMYLVVYGDLSHCLGRNQMQEETLISLLSSASSSQALADVCRWLHSLTHGTVGMCKGKYRACLASF